MHTVFYASMPSELPYMPVNCARMDTAHNMADAADGPMRPATDCMSTDSTDFLTWEITV